MLGILGRNRDGDLDALGDLLLRSQTVAMGREKLQGLRLLAAALKEIHDEYEDLRLWAPHQRGYADARDRFVKRVGEIFTTVPEPVLPFELYEP